MGYKKPEEKICNISYFDSVVEQIIGGIQAGYETESTLNEMIKRNSNGGLLGVEKLKIKLLKEIIIKLNIIIEEHKQALAYVVLMLEKDVVSDAEDIRNGDSDYFFDYETEYKRIENTKYEMSKYERSLNESEYLIKTLERV